MSRVDKLISFDISSDFGMFKKPDVNDVYFSFNIIPKPTLLGILGAVVGVGGYAQQGEKAYPGFYEEFKDLLIGIKPYGNKGVYQKRLIKYNNTVGYANKDGGTLNIIEQTLIEPKYKIYLGLDLLKKSHQKLNKFITEEKVQYEYIPYMGKNEFKLDIDTDSVTHFSNISQYNPNEDFAISTIFPNVGNEALKKSEVLRGAFDTAMSNNYFYYFERLPVSLDELNQYSYEDFSYTNAKLSKESKFIKTLNLFLVDEKVICLY